jgi:exodeoxyribonuclease-5
MTGVWPGLTRHQAEVADGVLRWLNYGTSPFALLTGAAGTGKTTVITALGQSLGGVAFAAFTNKAASVLRLKGARGATTLHSLLYYHPGEDDAGELHWRLRPHLECGLIIADEASMVSVRLGRDLMSFEVPVLVTADLFQLPPIEGSAYFAGHRPDFTLREVHRQAVNSQPLKLATAIRAGELVTPIRFDRERMVASGIVITALHTTRRATNKMVRRARGISYESFGERFPQPGETVLCFRSDHNVGVMNGETWCVERIVRKDSIAKLWLADGFGAKAIVRVPETDFLTGPPKQPRQDGLGSFDFGYAITCWKAQGSEWNSVCVLDETNTREFHWIAEQSGLPFDEFRRRWLYTAVTRACREVVVMRPPP